MIPKFHIAFLHLRIDTAYYSAVIWLYVYCMLVFLVFTIWSWTQQQKTTMNCMLQLLSSSHMYHTMIHVLFQFLLFLK